MDSRELHRLALARLTRDQTHPCGANTSARSGFHHDNVKVETPDGIFLVRIPISQAMTPDPRLWPEKRILPVVNQYVAQSPKLLYSSEDPLFHIHEYIDGVPLRQVSPHGEPVPTHVFSDVAAFLAQLAEIPLNALPPLPARWSTSDSRAFAQTMYQWTRTTHSRFVDKYSSLFAALGIPRNPLAPLELDLSSLNQRTPACLHADLHRGNILIRENSCVFLDWELALWGDPVYELAVHLNKMRYQPAEREQMLQQWLSHLSPAHTRGWEEDLPFYLAHERIKFAVNDTVRYAQAVHDEQEGNTPRTMKSTEMLPGIKTRLDLAYPQWTSEELSNTADTGKRESITEAEIADIVLWWRSTKV
jgi:aminoglycoside phosphotransferase (APT) family kinase protein